MCTVVSYNKKERDKMKLRENKKGISPLIATVLLIGFAIALAILVYFWWGNILREQAQKQLVEAPIICAEQVELSAKDATCYNEVSPTGDYFVLLYLENKGSVTIDDLRVRIIGATSSTTVTIGEGLKKTQTKQTSVPYNIGTIGQVKQVVVEPILIRGGKSTTCREQAITLTNIPACPP